MVEVTVHEIKRALDYIGNKFSLKCFDDHRAKWLWANCEEGFFCFVLVPMPLTDLLASSYFADSMVLIPLLFHP